MLDPDDLLRLAAAAAVALAGVGVTIAWLPAFRYGGGPALMARILVTAGLLAVVWDARGLGGMLGLMLTAMGMMAVWQGQPEPEVPRPRRRGILAGAAATAVVIVAVFEGWWVLDRLPEATVTPTAAVLGAIGGLGTLAIADRSRIRLRDAVRARFGVPVR